METIVFIASFSVLVLMIVAKAFDLKVKKIVFWQKICQRGDKMINDGINGLVIRANYFRKITHIFLFDFIPSLVYEWLSKMKDKVAERYYNSSNDFRGRRLLRTDGSVSSFLERLAEDRKQS